MKKLLERMRYYAGVVNTVRSSTPRICNLCGYSGKFHASGLQPRCYGEPVFYPVGRISGGDRRPADDPARRRFPGHWFPQRRNFA